MSHVRELSKQYDRAIEQYERAVLTNDTEARERATRRISDILDELDTATNAVFDRFGNVASYQQGKQPASV